SAGFLRISDAPVQVDQPPTISAIPAQNMTADGVLTVDFQISDPDTALADLNLRGLSSNTELIPVPGLPFTGAGSDRVLDIRPSPSATGTTTITVLLSDGRTEVASQFEVTVAAPNLKPV